MGPSDDEIGGWGFVGLLVAGLAEAAIGAAGFRKLLATLEPPA